VSENLVEPERNRHTQHPYLQLVFSIAVQAEGHTSSVGGTMAEHPQKGSERPKDEPDPEAVDNEAAAVKEPEPEQTASRRTRLFDPDHRPPL
jgi:hypothetical protein